MNDRHTAVGSAPAGHEDVGQKLLSAVERLGRAIRAARQQVATEHGLSLLGTSVLELLARKGSTTIGELAAELDVSQPTISDAVATLEGHGLVERTRSESDGRVTVVSPTTDGAETGRRIAAELAPVLSGDQPGRSGPDDGRPGDGVARERRGLALEVLLEEILRLQRAGVITVNRSCLSCRHHQPQRGRSPARCLLLDADLAPEALRVDCPEHDAA